MESVPSPAAHRDRAPRQAPCGAAPPAAAGSGSAGSFSVRQVVPSSVCFSSSFSSLVTRACGPARAGVGPLAPHGSWSYAAMNASTPVRRPERRRASAADLAQEVGVAQRLHAEGRRPQARAPEERTHPRTELLLQRLHARSGEDLSSRTPTDRKCPKRPVASIEIRQRGEPLRRSGRPAWEQPVWNRPPGVADIEWGAEKVPRKAGGPEARLPPPCSDAPRTRFGTPTRAGRRGSLRVEGCVRAPPSRIRGRPETQPPGLLEAEVPAPPLPHPHKHQPVTLPAPVHFVAGPAPLPRIRGARGTQPRSLIMTTPGRSFAHPAAP